MNFFQISNSVEQSRRTIFFCDFKLFNLSSNAKIPVFGKSFFMRCCISREKTPLDPVALSSCEFESDFNTRFVIFRVKMFLNPKCLLNKMRKRGKQNVSPNLFS